MPSLMDSLSQTATPEVLGTIGKRIGVDSDTMQKGMDAATPAVLGSLSKTASTPGGLDSILSQMSSMQSGAQGGDVMGSVLGSMMGGGGGGLGSMLGGLLGGGGAMPAGAMGAMGGGLAGMLMGPALGAISGTLSKSLGFDVGPILSVAAPLLMGVLGQHAATNNLDKQGVANLLQSENKAYVSKGGPTAQLVQSALDAGDKATTMVKGLGDNYSKLQVAPVLVAKLVAQSPHSGPIGTAKEMAAGAAAVAESVKAADPSSLVKAVFSTDPAQGALDAVTKMDPTAQLSYVGSAVSALAASHPNEAATVRGLLMNVAQKTAEGAKEGGFLGIGGTKVSKEEQAAIDAIRKVIGA